MQEKQMLLRNVSQYAEHLFQKWKHDDDDDRDASTHSSWYEQAYWARATRRNDFSHQKSRWDTYRNRRKGHFQFCDSDEEEEDKTEFWSSAGGRQGFYWSFCEKENPHWTYYSGYDSQRDSSYRRDKSYTDEDKDEDGEDTSLRVNFLSERRALGLCNSGPLKLTEVKEAFRTCALRWHPDRHSGASKAEAEEKFKSCLAAYQSLCKNLAVS